MLCSLANCTPNSSNEKAHLSLSKLSLSKSQVKNNARSDLATHWRRKKNCLLRERRHSNQKLPNPLHEMLSATMLRSYNMPRQQNYLTHHRPFKKNRDDCECSSTCHDENTSRTANQLGINKCLPPPYTLINDKKQAF